MKNNDNLKGEIRDVYNHTMLNAEDVGKKFVVLNDEDGDFPKGSIVIYYRLGCFYKVGEDMDESLYMLESVELERYYDEGDRHVVIPSKTTSFITVGEYTFIELLSAIREVNCDLYSVVREDGRIFKIGQDYTLIDEQEDTTIKLTEYNMDATFRLVKSVELVELTLAETLEYLTKTDDEPYLYLKNQFTHDFIKITRFTSMTNFGAVTFNNLYHMKFYKEVE